jgi:hypothetical protein
MIMKKILLLSFAALLIAGGCHAQVKTPPHAASTRTWTYGNQVWSDAIRMPECDKSDFILSNTSPDCRKKALGGGTWYYYNWSYVKVKASKLCPSPWRVPSLDDLKILKNDRNSSLLYRHWETPDLDDCEGCTTTKVSYGCVWGLGGDNKDWYPSLSWSAPHSIRKAVAGIGFYPAEMDKQVRCVR